MRALLASFLAWVGLCEVRCAERRAKDGGLCHQRCRSAEELSVGVTATAPGVFGQQFADDHEIVGVHRGADKQREALGAFGATLHAAAAHQHGNAPLDAGTEALALLECGRSFVSLALRRLAAATLWNARHRDAAARTDDEIVLAEEAAIRAVELRGAAESTAVTPPARAPHEPHPPDCP
jgi:hypothetical protein